MKKPLLALSLALTFASIPAANAQWAVIDAGNLVENIVSALENTKTVANQITQLSHEVQSLANQAQNLKSMPSTLAGSVLSTYTSQFAQLNSAMQSIGGIAQNLSKLTAQFNATYPTSTLASGVLSNANISKQLTAWLSQTRGVYQGAYNTQAQVMGSLGADTSTIQGLVSQSSQSHGALDAIETGNQINGQVAAQLMKLNQQIASTNQAQLNWIAQQTQMIAQAQANSQALSTGYTTKSSATVDASITALH
jgi:P-type conjugative transfer protein TrbJ